MVVVAAVIGEAYVGIMIFVTFVPEKAQSPIVFTDLQYIKESNKEKPIIESSDTVAYVGMVTVTNIWARAPKAQLEILITLVVKHTLLAVVTVVATTINSVTFFQESLPYNCTSYRAANQHRMSTQTCPLRL